MKNIRTKIEIKDKKNAAVKKVDVIFLASDHFLEQARRRFERLGISFDVVIDAACRAYKKAFKRGLSAEKRVESGLENGIEIQFAPIGLNGAELVTVYPKGIMDEELDEIAKDPEKLKEYQCRFTKL
jgi:hypothetical protein